MRRVSTSIMYWIPFSMANREETKWSRKVSQFDDDVMHLSGRDVPIKRGVLKQADLDYWPHNPRIYSIVHSDSEALDQDEIQLELQKRDHVKELIKDIKYHGGLIDPVVVLDSTFEVIEGNSRLAAIRFLAQTSPVKFGAVRSIVLPATLDEKLIYSYLNQEHIKGKSQWSPYEQAGVIFRLIKDGMEFDALASELNISVRKAKSMYETYHFMVEHNEDKPARYSYYDVYLSNRKAQKRRDAEPNMDKRIIREIRDGQITAQDFRKMLPVVCDNSRQFSKFISGRSSILGAYEVLEREGHTEDLVKRLKRMHEIVRGLTKEEFDELTPKVAKNAEFHMGRIITQLTRLKKSVFGDK